MKKNKKDLTEDEILKMALSVASKTIGVDIDPVKYEDMPNKISEILSKCLKAKVEVSVDEKGMLVKVEKHKKD